MITKKEILDDLDNNAIYEFFLDLEHGYFYTASSRINLFADENRWAIVFEKSAFGNRTGRAEIELNYFGNCLVNQPRAGMDDLFILNTNWVTLIDNDKFDEIADGFELVSKNVNTVNIRGNEVKIEHDIAKYEERGIFIQDIENPNKQIDFPALVRYLAEEYADLFRATKDELTVFLPKDLPFLMKIDEWYHTPIQFYDGPPPSSNETFNLIAEILVSKDIGLWKPCLKPNNNWRNWPNAGSL